MGGHDGASTWGAIRVQARSTVVGLEAHFEVLNKKKKATFLSTDFQQLKAFLLSRKG